jgi:hypothetical protein
VVTSGLWLFLLACTYLRQPGLGAQAGGCHRDHPSFGAWLRSPGHVHQKRLEDDAGVGRAEDRADLVCRNHDASKVGSQLDSDNVEAARNQKGTPDNAVGYVLDRHDDNRGVTVTAGVVRGNRVLEDEICGGNSR